MVFGAIIDWTIYRTLDLTVGTLWWVASNTGYSIYNASCYLIGSKGSNSPDQTKKTNDDLVLLKEQNMLLKEQNELLRKRNMSSDNKSKESPF
uniref:Uncharacterized protein n=1 Tax=viral metagenome TaxID=1070528 RepID=A0A6C0E7L4_9ZZZZ